MDKKLETRLNGLINRVEQLFPPTTPTTFEAGFYRWQHTAIGIGHLQHLPNWQAPSLDQLFGLNDEIRQLRSNTAAFMAGKPANHAVLTGPRGCGKTTIVAGIASEFNAQGLITVLLDREHFHQLSALAAAFTKSDKKLLVICNELSFASDMLGLLRAKAALDDLAACGVKLLVYATSNRRHLVTEEMHENLATMHASNGEINPGETTEEKVSLSDRFGLWIPVDQPDEETYLAMVKKQLKHFGKREINSSIEHAALRWAEERGSFNGRIANQFVCHLLSLSK